MITIGLLSVSRSFCLQTLDEIEDKISGTLVKEKILIEDVFDVRMSQQIVNKATALGWKIMLLTFQAPS